MYPIESFPDDLQEFIRTISKNLQVPPSFVGTGLLCQAATLISQKIKVSPWCGWEEPAILWACVCAESGSNKSTALKQAIAYLRAIQDSFNHEYAEALNAENEEGPKPELKRIMISDVTVEALMLRLCKNPSMLWFYDELFTWFERLKTGNTNNIAVVLSLYDGHAESITRKTGDFKEIIPTNVGGLSVLGSIQLDILRKCLRQCTAFANGLAYRFLYVVEDPIPFDWMALAIDPDKYKMVIESYFRRFQNLQRSVDFVEGSFVIPYNSEASIRLREILNDLEKKRSSMESSALGKARGQIVRISLILHMLSSHEISCIFPQDVERAYMLWQYHYGCLESVITTTTLGWEDGVKERIYNYLQRRPDGLYSLRDLRQSFTASQRPSITQTLDIVRKMFAERMLDMETKNTDRGIQTYVRKIKE